MIRKDGIWIISLKAVCALFFILMYTMCYEKDPVSPDVLTNETLQFGASVQLYHYQYLIARR